MTQASGEDEQAIGNANLESQAEVRTRVINVGANSL